MTEFGAKILIPTDEKRVDAFLKLHTPFCYFMRSGFKRGGLNYEGKPYQGDFFGVYDNGKMVGILMHGWIGSLQIYVTDLAAVPALVKAWGNYRALNPRKVELFMGPAEQVKALLAELKIEVSSLRRGGEEAALFEISLDKVIMPPVLQKEGVLVRRAQKEDIDILTGWRYDFLVDNILSPFGQATHNVAKGEITRLIRDGDLFVLEEKGQLISFCAIGGFLTDWAHVGPVWTPPEKRNLGYGRAVTAGALKMLQDEGYTNAVLFALKPDAQKVFSAIGFNRIGNWLYDFTTKPIDRLQ
jgi:GNAT superfamily N-acetyltransferase